MPRHKRKRKDRGAYPLKGIWGKKKMRVSGSQKGYLQTGGLYGRFSGPKPEMKFLDGAVGGTAIAITGTMLRASHNIVGQGNGASERIGRKITIRSLQVKGAVVTFSTPVITEMDQRIRIMFVCDKQTNGAVAAIEDVIDFQGTPNINAFRNLANLSRFTILYDKTINLPVLATWTPGAAAGQQSVPVERGWSLSKKMNLTIEYDESFDTGVISTQRTNNIFAFALTSQALDDPHVHYFFRIRYTDA